MEEEEGGKGEQRRQRWQRCQRGEFNKLDPIMHASASQPVQVAVHRDGTRRLRNSIEWRQPVIPCQCCIRASTYYAATPVGTAGR